MYQQLTDRVGVFGGGVNVGVIRASDSHAVLVDTGANEGNARKLLRHVREELGLGVAAILTTHAHADHFGGHEFMVRRTDAAVYASPIEATILQHPELQPSLLFGGAAPPAALRERFILARPSPVHVVMDAGVVHVVDVEVDIVSLPGHSPNQVGYLVEGVFFCGDVIFPAAAIEKFRIPYLFDLDSHLASMELAARTIADWIVPGHGPVERDLAAVHALNVTIVEETTDAILNQLVEPAPLETVASEVFDAMDVPMQSHVSYYLLRPTIAAYLTSLEARGAVEHLMLNRQAYWRRH
ncbi:MAG: MBL fold metallo-hydrolase [Chloroflexia bacterium]|nr:MBL fold metallo-hydrolase [Chloroflexia bacterium]